MPAGRWRCAGSSVSPPPPIHRSVRFISFDSVKRGVGAAGSGGGGETCPAVLVHTAVDFGATFVDTGPSLVEPIILEHLRRVAPGLPPHVESHCHRWRYSQASATTRAVPRSPLGLESLTCPPPPPPH